MFKTLFSRMLATYLSVTLGLLILLGFTVGTVFQNQYKTEKRDELKREAQEISAAVTERYIDSAKRAVAEKELLTIARKYDAMVILQFADESLGRCVFIDEESTAKWAGCDDMDISSITSGILYGGQKTEVRKMLGDRVDMPTMSLTGPITNENGRVIAALVLHTDTSRIQESIRQVTMDVILYSCIGVVLAMLAVSYITGKMTKPITEMNNIVMRYSKGEFDLRVKSEGTDEVAQLGKSFNIMASELNTLEEARRSFVANVSHELRSPLTSMRGFLEAMQDGTIAQEDYAKYLDIVINENRRMTSMVNDLLDLARIESGQVVIKKEVFDINELIVRTMLTFEARVDAKKLNVELDMKPEKIAVEADPGQIAQVVRNLIDNAIKFTPEGGTVRLRQTSEKASHRQTAEQLSKALGSRTVLSGSVSRSKNDPSQSLQMMERPLMTPDELKSIPKGSFVVMKTGTHPMQAKLRLFLDWGITFGEPYITPEHAARPVTYASRQELFLRIDRAYGKKGTQPTQVQQAPVAERRSPYSAMGLYNEDTKT